MTKKIRIRITTTIILTTKNTGGSVRADVILGGDHYPELQSTMHVKVYAAAALSAPWM